jgi:tetrahydromethanopterin S-methyltransferase subunit B
VVDDDALYDGVVSLPFCETQPETVAVDCSGNFDTLLVDSIVTDIYFDVLFMSSMLMSCLLEDVEVLADDLAADLDVEDSLPGRGEVHLSQVGLTSANFRMRVTLPLRMGRS